MNKSFSSNGDIVLRPLKARVKKENNGDYYLDLETDLEYVDYLVEGNIVVANTPQDDQAFRSAVNKKYIPAIMYIHITGTIEINANLDDINGCDTLIFSATYPNI